MNLSRYVYKSTTLHSETLPRTCRRAGFNRQVQTFLKDPMHLNPLQPPFRTLKKIDSRFLYIAAVLDVDAGNQIVAKFKEPDRVGVKCSRFNRKV